MGTGSMENKAGYITKKGYYLSKDYDVNFGGDFYFLLEPLYGNDNERFFYVKLLDNGRYEVSGEFYIISATNEESLKRHKSRLRRQLKGIPIWYYHTDKDGKVIRKEKQYGF